jgi:hypothetical protein
MRQYYLAVGGMNQAEKRVVGNAQGDALAFRADVRPGCPDRRQYGGAIFGSR